MDISVYITSYNQLAYLQEAVQSVMAQTLRPGQIIIADDASTDGSQEYIKQLAEQHPTWITPVLHTQNQGVAATRNDALRAVTGQYVAALDGDDRYLPKKLEHEVALVSRHPNIAIAFSDHYIIDAQGTRIARWGTTEPPQGEIFLDVFARQFPKGRLFRDEFVAYHAWKAIDFYDESLQVYEDFDARIRLTYKHQAKYTGIPLSEHRRLSTGLSKLDGQIYLDAFNYIVDKNLPLAQKSYPSTISWLQKKHDMWRAYLWRRNGRIALSQSPPNRRKALSAYRRSLRLHRQFDIPFWLTFIFSSRYYNLIKQRMHARTARYHNK